MCKFLTSLIILLLFLPCQARQAEPIYTLYAGSARGTFYRISEDIVRACPKLNIQIVSTKGSLDNVNHLITAQPMLTGYRFAMAQQDVLTTISKSNGRVVAKMTPLLMYPEEITVIVNRASNIKSLKDLSGKRVVIGSRGSGTWFTSVIIRNKIGLDWVSVEKSQEESILGLIVGNIDAMFIIGGHPHPLLNGLSASVSSNIEILNIDGLNYNRSVLPAKTYLWQENPVNQYTVQANLIAAPDVPTKAIAALTSCISLALPDLRRWGHPKWKDIKSLR